MNRARGGFTLVELLVVVGIIAVLMMLLSPQIGLALAKSRETACRGNMSVILKAAAAYAGDHDGVLPSAWSRGPASTNPLEMCFVGQEVLPPGVSLSSEWPQGKNGTLVDYIGGGIAARRLYRCPALKPGPLRSGQGSNGYFDYAVFEVFAGVRQSRIPTRAQVNLGTGTEPVPCPWLVEEDPAEFLNAAYIQPFHKSTDRLGAWHLKRGNIGTADGAVRSIASKRRVGTRWVNPRAQDWRAPAPSGTEIPLYAPAVAGAAGWGWWNRQ